MIATPERHLSVVNMSMLSQKQRKKREKIRASPEWNRSPGTENERFLKLMSILIQRKRSTRNGDKTRRVKASETTVGGLLSGSRKTCWISGFASYTVFDQDTV